MDTLEQRTMARVSARLVPFLIVCYFIAYLDRVNVSFAALTMNKDLGLSASAYGFGQASSSWRISSSRYPPICFWHISARGAGLRASCSPGA